MIKQYILQVIFLGIALSALAVSTTNEQTSSTDLEDKIDQFQAWMENHSDADIENALQRFDLNDLSKWLNSRSETKDQIKNLEYQIKSDEIVLSEKRKLLGEIQSKINLIKLTPNQIASIEKYNQSLKQDPYFDEWITERSTWFEIGKDVLISAGFLIVGMLIEAKRKKKKRHHTT